MQKDSVAGTLGVASVLCICCSVLVAAAAVVLKPRQVANKELDIKKNILLASGLLKSASATPEEILEAYKKIRIRFVDLTSGEEIDSTEMQGFDQRKAAKDPEKNTLIPGELDLGGIKKRSRISKIYEVIEDDRVTMTIFPIHGKGLWSTLYGFIALSPDLSTIQGIGFYEHGETPGLGGEIDNPKWKAQWVGKKAFDQDLKPQIEVVKGMVEASDPSKDYKVDGLSGATITSNGVTGLVKYWLGEHGFGPFIEKYVQKGGSDVKN